MKLPRVCIPEMDMEEHTQNLLEERITQGPVFPNILLWDNITHESTHMPLKGGIRYIDSLFEASPKELELYTKIIEGSKITPEERISLNIRLKY